MVNRVQSEVQHLQKTLDAEAEKLSANMKISKSTARKRIKKAWMAGCIMCKQKGPTTLHFYKKHLYVICPDCHMMNKMELGEKAFYRSIARRLARRAKSSASRN
jgi:predicted transcriptional regulator